MKNGLIFFGSGRKVCVGYGIFASCEVHYDDFQGRIDGDCLMPDKYVSLLYLGVFLYFPGGKGRCMSWCEERDNAEAQQELYSHRRGVHGA